MVEPTFRALEMVTQLVVMATGTRITYRGEENVPAHGGAVVAINHTSYVAFLPAALAVHRRRRRLRFMIKAEMQQVKVVNFLIKHTRTIPVDRHAGADAYAVPGGPVDRLGGASHLAQGPSPAHRPPQAAGQRAGGSAPAGRRGHRVHQC